MRQIEKLSVSNAIDVIQGTVSPLAKILSLFSKEKADNLEKKKRFNSLLKEFQEMESIEPIESGNLYFHENEEHWQSVFDELNRLRAELSSDNYSFKNGYQIS